MIGSSDSHPFGTSARRLVVARQRGQHHSIAPFQARMKPNLPRTALLLLVRLKRFINGRVAAAIAHHERQAASWARHELDHRQLDSARIYRGPVDQVFAKAVKFSKRAA
jgi:hypothetical protein